MRWPSTNIILYFILQVECANIFNRELIFTISFRWHLKNCTRSNQSERMVLLAYFREKLLRRNVGVDVKHFEHCEQFFASIGKCYLTEALLEFLELENTADKPTCLLMHKDLSVEDVKEKYVNAIDKFV